MPECGELKTKIDKRFKVQERILMWDCKHEEWIDVTPPPNYKMIYEPIEPVKKNKVDLIQWFRDVVKRINSRPPTEEERWEESNRVKKRLRKMFNLKPIKEEKEKVTFS